MLRNIFERTASSPCVIKMRANKEENRRKQREYAKEHYDQVCMWLKKGKREEFRAQAIYRGMSLSGYIVHLLEEDGKKIEKEKAKKAN